MAGQEGALTPPDFRLDGRKALVTGGATGIGAAIAAALAACGADVAITTHASPATGLEARLAAAGKMLRSYRLDLAGSTAAERSTFVDAVERDCGGIDILVNNAGIIRRGAAVDHPLDNWADVLELNLNVPWQLSQAFGRQMLARGHGKVIMLASMLSYQGGVTVPGYAASKHAIVGLTRALANEWAGSGVNVNAIAPGYIETGATAALRADPGRSRDILARIPAGRWGQPSDIAGAAVFLAGPASGYINGHVLAVDGGWLAR